MAYAGHSGCCHHIPTHLGGLQTFQSSTLSSGRHPSDSSRWMTEKQTNDGSSQSQCSSPATWRLFAIHFVQENWVPGPLRLQLWLQTKTPKFLAQRDIATYIAISTSFELSPLPLSFSTTKTPQFLAGSLVNILDNFVCSWVFAVARGHLGKLMMSRAKWGVWAQMSRGEQCNVYHDGLSTAPHLGTPWILPTNLTRWAAPIRRQMRSSSETKRSNEY